MLSRPDLSKYEVFRSTDLRAAESFVADIFAPHKLEPLGVGEGEVRMDYAPLDNLAVCFLDYGGAVDIDAEVFGDFFLVQFPLRGTMVACAGDDETTASRLTPVVLSATHDWDLRWGADCASLLIRVERAALEETLARMLGQHLSEPLVFETEMSWRNDATRGLWHHVRALASDLRVGGTMVRQPQARAAAEQVVLHALLCAQKHNYSAGLAGGISPAAPRHVKRVEEFIRAKAREPITIEEMVAVCGVSMRSLYDGFRKFRGTSPMRYLRDYRLDRVRQDLKNADESTAVTPVATRWGFAQLGRFAAQYKARFGETPSETLKAAQLKSG